MNKVPTISVIVPCFNSAAFVGHTLASLQSQTFPDWEAILVDDGSTDGTGEIINLWAERDKRIRLVTQTNQGLGKARNVGLSHASGKFIHFLDADDWMLHGAYSKMAARLPQKPDIAGVYCGVTVTAQNGTVTNQCEPLPEGAITFERLALYNPFAIHTVLIRRDVFDFVGAFDETLQHCQDWDLWGRVARCGFQLAPVAGPLAVYRMVRQSLSAQHHTFWTTGLAVLKRLYSEDHRCQTSLQNWVNGADKAQYPHSLRKWILYCLPRAIFSGDSATVEEILATTTSNHNASPEAGELSAALLSRLVVCNPEGPDNFSPIWQERKDLTLSVLGQIGEASNKPTYVSDVLGRFLWGLRRVSGIRQSLRIGATVPNYLVPFVFKEAQQRTRQFLRIS